MYTANEFPSVRIQCPLTRSNTYSMRACMYLWRGHSDDGGLYKMPYAILSLLHDMSTHEHFVFPFTLSLHANIDENTRFRIRTSLCIHN